jgi:hypothetical protein
VGFLVLWLENLAVSLLLMALVTACVGRWQRQWLRAVAWTAVSLAVLSVYACWAAYAGILQFSGTPGFHWFYYALALAIAVLIGTVSLRVVGLRRTPETASPAVAARWPRAKLFAAWAVVLALHTFTIGNLDQAANQQLEAIRSEALAQIRAATPPPVPDSGNAAILYEVAAEVICSYDSSSRDEEKQQDWLEGFLKAFNAKDPALERLMQEKGSVVQILREAGERPACVVEPDYRIPFAVSSRSFAHAWIYARNLAILLDIHSRWKLAEGDRRAAFQDVDALFRYAGHMSKAGLLWPASATKYQALRSLQYLLSSLQPTTEELQLVHIDEFWSCRKAELRNWPVSDSQLRWFVQGWGSEHDWARSFGMTQYRSPSLGTISNSPWYRIFLLQNDLAIVDRISSETEGQLSVPYWVAAKQAAERPTLRERILKRHGPHGVMIASFLVQFFGDIPLFCANADARHATAVVALAVARFQAKHGRLPDNLGALVPEFLALAPRDPFDGKPIRFKHTDRGAVVYSIGPDAVDDGGIPLDEKTDKGDILFELPLKP